MLFQVQCRVTPPSAVIRCEGELDLATCDELRRCLRDARDQGVRTADVDLSEVSFIDCSGLGVLVESVHDFTAVAGGLRLSATSPQVARLIELTRTGRVFAAAGANGPVG